MDKKSIALLLMILVAIPLFSGCIEEEVDLNEIPVVEISYPYDNSEVSSLVMISGTASDLDGDDQIENVQVMINDNEWLPAEGTIKWSFHWSTYEIEDGLYNIKVRAWDGFGYSEVEGITVRVDNPESVETDSHKWAVFVAVANFAPDNESKLGNGGLDLAEEMVEYLVQKCGYSTSNIILLFDDGWIRSDNGYGERLRTLKERRHDFDITYGGAIKENVLSALKHVVDESNSFEDSEVFIWFFAHGCGNEENELTGDRVFKRSEIQLWDSTFSDEELGHILEPLHSQEVCVIVDACFSGGFADKTIYNFPTFFLLKSGLPQPGRVIITGASKYRVGYASTTRGPLFSFIWFNGIKTGEADGYRPGLFNMGRQTILKRFKDGKVSVEEAFFYARYVLRKDKTLEEYKKMEPQINDMYRQRLLNNDELILG